MTVEHGAAEADVRIRTPGRQWIWLLVWGGCSLVLAADNATSGRPWIALLQGVTGCAAVGMAWARRGFGIDLTPESAIVRGFRRQAVPWKDVQAVVRHETPKSAVVRLILEDGEPVRLRYPASLQMKWDPQGKRDFQRIEQWWLAHRGESWRPVHPEAPGSVRG
jgi:hypothetical protein